MPSTLFTDGETSVAAAWLNKIFGTGGHVHDGADADGSAPKVHLGDHVDYGTNGRLVVTNDDTGAHEITHETTGAFVSRFITGVLKAGWLEVTSNLMGTNPTLGAILLHAGAVPKGIGHIELNADGAGAISVVSSALYNLNPPNIIGNRVITSLVNAGAGLNPGAVQVHLHSQNDTLCGVNLIGGVNVAAGLFGANPWVQKDVSGDKQLVKLIDSTDNENFFLDIFVF